MTWLAAPALPLDEAGKYVAGAYIVFVALILVYVGIMAAKLVRIDRELTELAGHRSSSASCSRWAPPTRPPRCRCARSSRCRPGGPRACSAS